MANPAFLLMTCARAIIQSPRVWSNCVCQGQILHARNHKSEIPLETARDMNKDVSEYIYIYIHNTYIHTYVYIYVYIYLSLSLYIYIYTHTYTYTYSRKTAAGHDASTKLSLSASPPSSTGCTVDFRNFIVFFGPRPWHIEIRHRVKETSTINLFGFETLKLKIRRLKLWKPTVGFRDSGRATRATALASCHTSVCEKNNIHERENR